MSDPGPKTGSMPRISEINLAAFPVGSLESRAAARALAEAKRWGNQISPELVAGITDPLFWLQHCTCTRDSHWRETGAKSAYRPFPKKP